MSLKKRKKKKNKKSKKFHLTFLNLQKKSAKMKINNKLIKINQISKPLK